MFFNPISVSEIISAIFMIYQRNSNFIGDFQNISAQLKFYQRFSRYIDLTTKNNKIRANCTKTLFGTVHFQIYN
ncbi:hypothetical protein COA08_19240 [Bacillus cereus]|uniref:Uncharacterized protein n=1 Tax=Bacillus cereus TaxID=1396 RepID=A0A2B8SZQ4_BACCE|nr:hypothetical protein CON06_09895 [Bacillus cereus]PFA13787.1 hypothetical protein CN382_11750 [Bacillus cereus]PFM38018.1 hypothetical protein COJ43_17455 [Bacillus cereus]PGL58015.1 hypothetical protein CN927_21370 [Bacillus cereus]PGQ07039.1 hypothetical protein COA08_19240 [Bacillus cereus]